MTRTIEELLEVIDIEDVLGDNLADFKLTHGSRGEQVNVRECPVCGDSRWKVYLNRESGLGNCFHGDCQATFNKWSFAKAITGHEGAELVRYLEKLAADMGFRVRRRATVAVEDDAEWELPRSIPLPTADGRNLRYLEERGFDEEIVGLFRLRYCDDGWFNYVKANGERGGMNFAQRVIIPVYDLDGSLVTFQGRDITGTSDRKYLFPPGLPGTAKFLLNGQNATGAKRVVMGEGVFDVMAIHKAIRDDLHWGDAVAVGSFGMHLSVAQGDDQLARLLALKKKGMRELYVMWDGERKAHERAVEAAAKVARHGIRTFVCKLPQGKDPNECDSREIVTALDAATPVTQSTLLRLKLGNPYG